MCADVVSPPPAHHDSEKPFSSPLLDSDRTILDDNVNGRGEIVSFSNAIKYASKPHDLAFRRSALPTRLQAKSYSRHPSRFDQSSRDVSKRLSDKQQCANSRYPHAFSKSHMLTQKILQTLSSSRYPATQKLQPASPSALMVPGVNEAKISIFRTSIPKFKPRPQIKTAAHNNIIENSKKLLQQPIKGGLSPQAKLMQQTISMVTAEALNFRLSTSKSQVVRTLAAQRATANENPQAPKVSLPPNPKVARKTPKSTQLPRSLT